MKKNIKIALVGQPNVGKSMLANAIADTNLHVGNFTGVTVEKKEIYFKYKEHIITIVDLPGTYMLNDYSIEEKVTNQFLKNDDYDIILNVADCTNLERNLQLTSELLSLDKKNVIALNMIDEAKKENIDINAKYMSELLNVSIVKISALKGHGINNLLNEIVKTYDNEKKQSKLIFSETIEEEITNIVSYLKQNNYKSDNSYRKIAIDLIREDKATYNALHSEPIWIGLQQIILDSISHIKLHYNQECMIDIMAEEFMAFNQGIIKETVKTSSKNEYKKTTTQKIDDILIHPIFGVPIFLFFMWGLFQLTFTIGSIPMDLIDSFFTSLGNIISGNIANDNLRSLIVDGLLAGVSAVVLFLPNIMILYIGIALLESTGYMSRVAFLLDGFFHKFGLHGQSFIPLVTGFGCSIPAYMSARILKNDRDRLLTLFIIGFMSCGARLPIYVLIVGAFFSLQNAGNILFAIYISGALIGLIMAKILKIFVFKGEDEPFVMEMPKYRIPSFKLISHTVKTKTKMYLKKAGSFIAIASILIWFASNYPNNMDLKKSYETRIQNAPYEKKTILENKLNEKLLEQSYLGQMGKFIEPIFIPIGMDWKMAVALQSGLAAKEVVVSTLSVLYSLGEDASSHESLSKKLHEHISFASAVAFIIIIMTYLPCLAATIVFTKEAGGLKYAGYLFVFTSLVAYVLAFIAYHLLV